MPPSRRRPVPPTTPPPRRPKVAGLRHPGASADHPAPAESPSAESPQAEPQQVESPAEQTAVISAEPAESGAEPATESVPTPSPRPRYAAAENETEVPAYGPPAGEPAEVPGRPRRWPVMVDVRPADREPRHAPSVVVLALALATIVFAGLAAWFGLEATAGTANTNSALTDNVTTSQVIGQINSAVNTIFSYKYTNVDDTKKAAQNALVGKALCQYNNLFKLVQQNAPQQKLVLTTQVVNSGVQSLQGDLARVVIFADQQDTRTDTNQTSYAGAQFAVNAQRINGQWKISNIDTFTNQASTNAGC